MEKITFYNNNANQNFTIEKKKRNISMDLNIANMKSNQYANFNLNEKKNSYINSSKGKNSIKKINPLSIQIKKYNLNPYQIYNCLEIEKLFSSKKILNLYKTLCCPINL